MPRYIISPTTHPKDTFGVIGKVLLACYVYDTPFQGFR